MRAVYRNGLIYPKEPVPPELSEGQEVQVEWDYEQPSDDPAEIERWDLEWRRIGPINYEAGERERVRSALEQADRQAKEAVRSQMEKGL
jgi:predicted DNA-binding antitoxin AbrB/MazE fold protein